MNTEINPNAVNERNEHQTPCNSEHAATRLRLEFARFGRSNRVAASPAVEERG